MTRSRRNGEAGFHEFPLVFFTALSIAGAGVGTAQLTLGLLGWLPMVPTQSVTLFIGACLGLGLLLSMFHLGKPLRGPFALFRLGRSHLSNEVLVVSLATGAALLLLALPEGHGLKAAASLVLMVGSALTLLAFGLVYRLPGQLGWSGLAPVHPLVLGLGFGITFLLVTLPPGTQARAELLILAILLGDGLLVWERILRIGVALTRGIPAQARFMERRWVTFSFRLILGVFLPAAALLSDRAELAGLSLFVNLILDRFLFYGLAVFQSTEAEILRVEAALATPADPHSSAAPSHSTLSRSNVR